MSKLIPEEIIEDRIFFIRGQKVMIDRDLAELFNVKTKNLNTQVRRNIERFPEEFIFRITEHEKSELAANCSRFNTLKHSTSLPYAFTEHGVAMLATILKSKQAVQMSIYIIRVFVRIRKITSLSKGLIKKIDLLEKRVLKHDSDIRELVRDIRKMSVQPGKEKKIGFLK